MPDNSAMRGHVTFVGAGPGDPELLTLKGHRAISQADLVVYAGSLVPLEVIKCARPGAKVVDSAPLTLEECHEIVRAAIYSGGNVARVHTGDPSLYSTLPEQIALLEKDGISWEVIPGVTAACAAAAAAGTSFTIPEISQSLIITRQPGRTPMPEREAISTLASHDTAMAIYLSGKTARELQKELASCLDASTPVVCAHRVGWPDQKIVWCDVGDLAQCVESNSLERQTVFLVLPGQRNTPGRSRLYAPDFGHGFRNARKTSVNSGNR